MDSKEKKQRYVETMRELLSWIKNSKKGDTIIYHTGLLMKDREVSYDGISLKGGSLDKIANELWRVHLAGDVRLYQRRVCEGICEYLAVRDQ